MKITKKWLKEQTACQNGIDWVAANKLIGLESKAFVQRLIKADKLDWANWLITQIMKKKQCVIYAVYAAEQVIGIYEKQYPKDNRLRQAIEAAKACIANPSKANNSAAWAACSAADSAGSAADLVYSAYWAADSAYWAARSASGSADSAGSAADSAYSAYWAACSANAAMKTKILNYGLKLLK